MDNLFPLVPLQPSDHVAIWSPKLAAVPNLGAFLGAKPQLHVFGRGRIGAVAAWGVHGLSARARRYAARHQIPFAAVEEGFFLGLDRLRRPWQPYSLVLDGQGIYYDATRPSDLETLLNRSGWETPDLLERARQAIRLILQTHVSKYNEAPDASPYLLTTPGLRTRILIVDQDQDDMRVRMGMGDSGTFLRMLQKARDDHPGAAFFIKTHPLVVKGIKKGYLSGAPETKGITFISQDVAPLSLLAQADEVYTVTSQMGFEALLLGKRVHCFGMPFYAGWGLTEDSLSCSRRVQQRTVEELFAAACILYARYVNPVTGLSCELEDILRLLAEQRLRNDRNSRFTCCLGFSSRQYAVERHFLYSTRGELESCSNEEEAIVKAEHNKGRLTVPGAIVTRELEKRCARHGVPLIRLQPGLLSGLRPGRGLPFTSTPDSIVLDRKGLYDEPARPSGLEEILENAPFSPPLLQRAKRLREFLVQEQILVAQEFALPQDTGAVPLSVAALPEGTTIILVPGQDEASAPVKLGGAEVKTNQELIKLVREARPTACIVYLHPGGSSQSMDSLVMPEADLILSSVSLPALLAVCHEVHTLSSPCGMDALLRGVPVYTYGGPYYAGWGLTIDRLTFKRRSRPLTLDGLVAASLILYPVYYDWRTHMICGPEDLCALQGLPAPGPIPLFIRLSLWWSKAWAVLGATGNKSRAGRKHRF